MIPLNTHTHYSLLQGYCKPDQLAELAAKYEYPALAITDFNTLSGTVNFFNAFKDSGVKPLVGTKLRLAPSYGYITLIAKNFDGWKELIALFSYTNASIDGSITLEHLKFSKNCIAITGDINSSIVNIMIAKPSIYTVPNPSQSLSFYLSDNYEAKIKGHLLELKEIFGDNLYVGIQRNAQLPIDMIITDMIEVEATNQGIKMVALNNTYTHSDEELEELQLLLCSREKTKFSNMRDYVNSEEHGSLFRFFNQKKFGLYEKEYYKSLYPDEYIKNTEEVLSKTEQFSILKNPEAPKFECPDGLTSKEYLLKLCREGWKRVTSKLDKNKSQEYVSRIQYELEVINRVGIEGYFLIVQDYVNWAKERMMVGPGRGSASGCLTSYFLGITGIDPLKYNLMFERFYNEGRNSPGKISFPDIDVDFPVAQRESVMEYIRNKYGRENVCQVFTLQEIQGRSAAREVLRINGILPEFINEISKKFPQKAAIADKLEEEKEKSIIRWTLNNDPDLLKDWCRIENGELVGEYAEYFKTAIKIEGTLKTYGKHASAVVISNEPISSICPMIKDKSSNELLAAIEYEELELMGLLKVDVLGTTILDKLTAVNDMLEFGYIKNNIDIVEEDDESI